jgi:hypothetical protein
MQLIRALLSAVGRGSVLALACAALVSWPSQAAVLPEERADAMFHYYEGGGVEVSGPALLVRKTVNDNASVYGRYYVDAVSGASIDVITTASPYRDQRTEYSAGIDFLHGANLMSASFTRSREHDYLADSYNLGISHDLFGGLTTLNVGYGQGHDTVLKTNDPTFEDSVNRYNFRVGVTQVLTRSLLASLSYEDVSESGYLNNPYRKVWIQGAPGSLPSPADEVYPHARDSQALGAKLIWGFTSSESHPVLRSMRFDYRYYRDSWGVRAHTAGVSMQRYFADRWVGEIHWRYYRQSAASFYMDVFPSEMTYMARDKELSTFEDYSLGIKASWHIADRLLFLNRAVLNFEYDFIHFDYKDFTDIRTGQPYSFGANVVQLFLSGWY